MRRPWLPSFDPSMLPPGWGSPFAVTTSQGPPMLPSVGDGVPPQSDTSAPSPHPGPDGSDELRDPAMAREPGRPGQANGYWRFMPFEPED